jgi:LuxR family maltose regulon positive regulatory protein
MKGNVVEAQRWFSEALKLSKAAGSITVTLSAIMGIANVQTLQGRLNQAAETYRGGLRLAEKSAQQRGQAVPGAAPIHLGFGDLLRERNILGEAAYHLDQGIKLGQQWHDDMVLRDGYIFKARLKQAQCDMVGAWKAIQQAEKLHQVYQQVYSHSGPIAARRAQLTLAEVGSNGSTKSQNQLDAVAQWAATRELRTDGSIFLLDEEFEHLIWARLLLARHKPEQAAQLLAHLAQAAEDGGRTGRKIEVLILQALAQQALGGIEQALIALERALFLTESEGYVRIFVDEGKSMEKLLRKSVHRGMDVDYVGNLLEAFEPNTEKARTPVSQSLCERLTNREIDVLKLLATDLSGLEIANELMVSKNTMHTHTKSIYSKLNVHNRRAALKAAEELNLL